MPRIFKREIYKIHSSRHHKTRFFYIQKQKSNIISTSIIKHQSDKNCGNYSQRSKNFFDTRLIFLSHMMKMVSCTDNGLSRSSFLIVKGMKIKDAVIFASLTDICCL